MMEQGTSKSYNLMDSNTRDCQSDGIWYRDADLMECGTSKRVNPLEDESKGRIFTCTKCGLEEHYIYKGKHPPFNKKVTFLEACYVLKDPFSPPKNKEFLVLGSDCSLCNRAVCQAAECSIFYTKRFCRTCAMENLKYFPSEVQIKLNRLN